MTNYDLLEYVYGYLDDKLEMGKTECHYSDYEFLDEDVHNKVRLFKNNSGKYSEVHLSNKISLKGETPESIANYFINKYPGRWKQFVAKLDADGELIYYIKCSMPRCLSSSKHGP